MLKTKRTKLITLLLVLSLFFAQLSAAQGQTIPLPEFTETDCEWDEQGNLVRQTAHTLDGAPALNARGFHRAEYGWDAHGNLLSEAYFGLNGEPVDTDTGYARAEYVYIYDRSERYQVVSEDR